MNITAKQQLVLDAITTCPAAANDDSLLQATVWAAEGFDRMYEQYGLAYALKHVTRSETLVRRRRELFNSNLITYTPAAQQDRMEAMRSEQEQARPTSYAAIPWMED